MRKHSRTQFYRAIKEMEEVQKWIYQVSSHNGWRRLFDLTEKGLQRKTWYYNHYYTKFLAVKEITDRFLDVFTGTVQPTEQIENSLENQTFFSKMVNVNDLTRYFILRILIKKSPEVDITGADIRNLMQATFGWQSSEGYFYDIIHEMEENLWLKGTWTGERRSKRYLRIEPEGKQAYQRMEEKVIYDLRNIQQFINKILELF